jgi:hypothetical protein
MGRAVTSCGRSGSPSARLVRRRTNETGGAGRILRHVGTVDVGNVGACVLSDQLPMYSPDCLQQQETISESSLDRPSGEWKVCASTSHSEKRAAAPAGAVSSNQQRPA